MLLIAATCTEQTPRVAEEFRYEADWDSIRGHYECPEWFRDTKFGIFMPLPRSMSAGRSFEIIWSTLCRFRFI